MKTRSKNRALLVAVAVAGALIGGPLSGVASAAYVDPTTDLITSTTLPGTGTGSNLTADDQENSGLIATQEPATNSGRFISGSSYHYYDWYFTIGDQWKPGQAATYADCTALESPAGTIPPSDNPPTSINPVDQCIRQHRSRIYGYEIDRATHKIINTKWWQPSDLDWADDPTSLDPNDWEAITSGPVRTYVVNGSSVTRHTLVISAMGDGGANYPHAGPGSTECANRRLIEVPEPDTTSSSTTYTPLAIFDVDSTYTALYNYDSLCNTESAWLGSNGKIHFMTKGNGGSVGNYVFQRNISTTAPQRLLSGTSWGTPSMSTNELEDHAGIVLASTCTTTTCPEPPVLSYGSSTRCWSTSSPPTVVSCSSSSANTGPYVITDTAYVNSPGDTVDSPPNFGAFTDLIAVNVNQGCTILRWTGSTDPDPTVTPPSDIFHPGCGAGTPGPPFSSGPTPPATNDELEGVAFVPYNVIPCTAVAGCGGAGQPPVPEPESYLQRRIEGVFDMNTYVPDVFHEEFTWQ